MQIIQGISGSPDKRTQGKAKSGKRSGRLWKRLAACMLGAVLLLTGCTGGQTGQSVSDGPAVNSADSQGGGQDAQSSPVAKGRYVEREVAWAENSNSTQPVSILPQGGELYLPDTYYGDAHVRLDGAEAQEGQEGPCIENVDSAGIPKPLQEHKAQEDYITDMVMAENGARMYTVFSSSETEEHVYYHDIYFLDAQGNETAWDGGGLVGREDSSFFTYGDDGYFYVMVTGDAGKRLFRVDTASGETKFLMDLGRVWNITVFGGRLFAETDEGISIYDLDTLEELEEDEGLTELVKGNLGVSNGHYGLGYLLYPGEDDSIYVATDKGLYRHVLYGNVSELVIDGTLCSLGDVSKLFTDMYVAEADGSGMPVFYFLYDNRKLMRFAYDADMPSMPEKTITLYSLNESSDIRMAIMAYQLLHPEIYVRYEIGMDGEDGVTREDALGSLATRIAAGEGPDIFLMDDLPLRSYKEKGVLMDLSGVYEELKAEQQYFDNVVNAMYTGDKLYTIPMMFSVPMMAGDAGILGNITDTESMVKAIEDYHMSKSGLRAGLLRPETTLMCLSYTHSGSWLREDGSLDREALTEFLTLGKRLYEADRADISQEDLDYRMDIVVSSSLDRLKSKQLYSASRGMYSMVTQSIYFGDAFALGALGGSIKNEFNLFYCALDQMEGESDYILLPGSGKTCLPMGMLAVNAASPASEEACDFVKYALSDYLGETQMMSGIPISRDVLLAMEENPYQDEPHPYEPYLYCGMGMSDGESITVDIAWQEPEVYVKYNALLDSLDGVNDCEYELLEAVIQNGAAALTGEKTIEETVDEIAKKIQLYLAE